MAQSALVLGETGTGKSRAIRGLDPEETVLINTLGKDLPFPGSRKLYTSGIKQGGNLYVPDLTKRGVNSAATQIAAVLKYISEERQDIKRVVLDDFNYLMSIEYFKGNKDGFARFDSVGNNAVTVFEGLRDLRADLTVFVNAHTEDVGKGEERRIQMKTLGRLFREKYTPEGTFTVVLMSEPLADIDANTIRAYRFRTQGNGYDVTKSPEGMFPLYIPNDFGFVAARMDEYYNEGTTLEESELVQEACAPLIAASVISL